MGIAVQGGSVPFYDLDGMSPKFGGNRDSRTATREGIISWANIEALVAELTAVAPGLPGQYPGLTMLYVNDFSIEPFAEDGGMVCGNAASYEKAKVSISYGKLDYSPSTLITRKWSFTGEFMTMPANSLKWDNNDPVENEEVSAAKVICMIEHSMTRHRAVSIPWTTIRSCIGHVNTSTLNDANFDNVAADTLLYLGASIDWTLSTDGSEVWTLEHRFQERKINWNGTDVGWQHFWRPDKKRWEKLKDDNGDYVYPQSSSFASLLA